MALNYTSDRFADVTVLRPNGRVTNEVAPSFQETIAATIADSSSGRLVLDFAGLDYIASGGLRAIAVGVRQCRERGGQLMVVALTSVVQEIFAISRFHQVVTVHAALPDALAAQSEAALAEYRAAEAKK